MTTKTAETAAVHQSSRRSLATEAEAALQHVHAQIGILRNRVLETAQNPALHVEREDVRQVSEHRAAAFEADQKEDLHMLHECPLTRKET
jgi:hypothetical protein